jgi:hypothetical protein
MNMVREPISILEEIATKAIRSGADAVEVEYKDGYEEVYPVSGPVGTSIGFALKSSSKEAKSLRADLYSLAKSRKRITVDGREYELRCRLYDRSSEHAFRLRWKSVKGTSKSRGQKTS